MVGVLTSIKAIVSISVAKIEILGRECKVNFVKFALILCLVTSGRLAPD